ncbi:MAG: putative secreted protein [Lachnospiraceae bacterium]|nr:putative secreted protein [Lachnospiraceae bacterium]
MAITIAGCKKESKEIDIQTGNDNLAESMESQQEDIQTEQDILDSTDENIAAETNHAELKGFETWEDSEATGALKRVLLFKETVTEAASPEGATNELTGKEYYLNKQDTFLDYKFESLLLPDQYAVVDLDQDGIPEVVVNLSSGSDGWFKVLRFHEGTVYGYSFVFRGFQLPKTDGTYMGSSGAADNTIMRLSFDGINVIENCLGSTTSSEEEVIYSIGGEQVPEEEYNSFMIKYYNAQDVRWNLFPSSIRAGYEGQELLRVDFTARTHAKVEDLKEYYSTIEDNSQFSHSTEIPKELCDLILEAMDTGTEQKALTPLMVGTKISQEEFIIQNGLQLDFMETVLPIKVDGDNDGVEDLIGQRYWGGTGGFSSMEFYKGSADGKNTLTNTFECFIQEFNFLLYEGNYYLLMEEFDYNTKYYSGYTLYLYENGTLADGKVFTFAIDDYDMNIVYEEVSFGEIDEVKNTLCNKKIPEILFDNDGVIHGSAETIYSYNNSEYEYSSDINNDGNQEYYNKSMWYPSNMGNVMSCLYVFEDSMILDDICSRLSNEVGDGRLYTFWIDKVNGKNLLYLYFGNNLDYSMYAFLINS